MVAKTKVISIKFKRGVALKNEDGTEKQDENGKTIYGAPVPARSVEVKNLTTGEAMDADDFALAVSPTGEPSRENRIRAFALCAIRKIDDKEIFRPRDLDDYKTLIDRFDPGELNLLALGHLEFVGEINLASDVKDSPSEQA